MAREKPGQTLDAAGLVHEAYVRLVGDQRFENTRHFFAAAAEAIRRILVENACGADGALLANVQALLAAHGTTPFDRKRIHDAAFDEVRRIIREEEPPRPSIRLTTLGETLPVVSAKRGTE